MTDHWKSLADKLGTPSIDEPESQAPPSDEQAATQADSTSVEPSTPPDEQEP